MPATNVASAMVNGPPVRTCPRAVAHACNLRALRTLVAGCTVIRIALQVQVPPSLYVFCDGVVFRLMRPSSARGRKNVVRTIECLHRSSEEDGCYRRFKYIFLRFVNRPSWFKIASPANEVTQLT